MYKRDLTLSSYTFAVGRPTCARTIRARTKVFASASSRTKTTSSAASAYQVFVYFVYFVLVSNWLVIPRFTVQQVKRASRPFAGTGRPAGPR